MNTRRLGVIGLLFAGAVIALGGCGGGGGSGRLSKEEYAAKANALCAAFHKKVDAYGNPASIAEMITMVEGMLPLDKQMVADFAKLEPPADEEAQAKRLVQLGNEQATRIEEMLKALKAGDMAKVNALVKEGSANDTESKRLFREIGITECAKD
jgi:galactokinase